MSTVGVNGGSQGIWGFWKILSSRCGGVFMSGKYPWTPIVTTEMVLLCAMNGSHSWVYRWLFVCVVSVDREILRLRRSSKRNQGCLSFRGAGRGLAARWSGVWTAVPALASISFASGPKSVFQDNSRQLSKRNKKRQHQRWVTWFLTILQQCWCFSCVLGHSANRWSPQY